VNVIGTAVAWVLAAITLLENPFGSGLVRDSVDGNNFVQAGKRLFNGKRSASHSEDAEGYESKTAVELCD